MRLPLSVAEPSSFPELFTFYHDYLKLLYSTVQTTNSLPVETLFEMNAALDHISKYYVYQEPEAKVVAEAYSHFKRSCLDIFKLKVRDARDQYEELGKIDTSLIDNGDFDRQRNVSIGLRQLVTEFTEVATPYRSLLWAD